MQLHGAAGSLERLWQRLLENRRRRWLGAALVLCAVALPLAWGRGDPSPEQSDAEVALTEIQALRLAQSAPEAAAGGEFVQAPPELLAGAAAASEVGTGAGEPGTAAGAAVASPVAAAVTPPAGDAVTPPRQRVAEPERPARRKRAKGTKATKRRKAARSLMVGLPRASTSSAPRSAPVAARLEATAIQRTVRQHHPALRQSCWQRALAARAPGAPSSAKVIATLTIDPSGRVQSVKTSPAPRGYPGLATCIEKQTRGWVFPRAQGETVTQVPFVFVAQ